VSLFRRGRAPLEALTVMNLWIDAHGCPCPGCGPVGPGTGIVPLWSGVLPLEASSGGDGGCSTGSGVGGKERQ